VSADLRVTDLSVRYGHVTAVDGISLEVPSGAIVAVLGANGAGKSSTLRALAGGLKAQVKGDVELFGESVGRRASHRMVARGMVLVPEGRQVIAPLTVEENLLLGGYRQRSRQVQRDTLARIYELFPVLLERRRGVAGLLSGGEQQMLAFGRAMMARPRLILMDEPSMGLAPVMVDRVMKAVATINEQGTSILLVEQNATAAFRIATEVYILDQGQIVRSGPTAEVRADPVVEQAFLGLRERAQSAEAALEREAADSTPPAR
jgi:branched-chain amino acid transport system ATP-binding protein